MEAFYSEWDAQDQNDSVEQDPAFHEFCEQSRLDAIESMEASGYSDAMDIEQAVASGFDPWAGMTIEEWARANKFDLVTA